MILLAAAGALLIVGALADALATTLVPGGGGGPLTRLLMRGLAGGLRRLPRPRRPWLLSLTGPLVLLATFLAWNLLVWLGWWLVFSSTDGAVRDATTSAPASATGRAYFAGYVVFTLGIGDLVPGAGLWRLLTVLATFLGLALVTLAITYLVSVLSAAVSRRALALQVTAQGGTGPLLVERHWQDGWSSLDQPLQQLTSQVLSVTEQHLAYPVLHAFASASPEASAPRAMAALDDALVLLTEAVVPDRRPARAVTDPLRVALEHYAQTVTGTGERTGDPPPAPDLALLRAAGVPLVEPAELARALARHAPRRARLAGLVRSGGSTWPDAPPGPA